MGFSYRVNLHATPNSRTIIMGKYRIPLFDLNFGDEEEWITMVPRTETFENKFKRMIGSKYALAFTNCTSCLHTALKILNISENDEVITPSLTFVATVNAILYVNATPVFCDIESYENLNMDTKLLESLVTKKTKAIMAMHYGGFPCNMNAIMKLAEKYNLKIIEDASHGPLSEYRGEKLGTFGDFGCFSFFTNKNISTGEGGMLVTNNETYYRKAKLIRSHSMTTLSYQRVKGHATSYEVADLGYNYRIDDIRSSIGIVQLGKLKRDIEKRQKLRALYIRGLADCKDILIPFQANSEYVSNYIFPVVLMNSNRHKRDQIRNRLHTKAIQTSVHYPSVHRFQIYDKYNAKLPNTEYVSDNEITLPLYGNLGPDEVAYITSSLKGIL
jgi:dTDP-4-amino-4,6-dideoxygalactose transaminase